MSGFNLTFFMEPNADARGSGEPHPTLYIHPGGSPTESINLQISSSLSGDEKLQIADSILLGVQRWRDQIAADAERRRTAEDELAAARAEIERLKAEREGEDPVR
ncbi:hypothetical protein ACIPWE_38415 [Streptomyces sp. NPDC090073]|uniref:hypothetical protein n=1 Tax=Streptomyces sp. NPDC090073 TaxID=3365936 RepID=UPI003826CB77